MEAETEANFMSQNRAVSASEQIQMYQSDTCITAKNHFGAGLKSAGNVRDCN
jgi:hypothetical protein